ncbi:hypothetical protein DFP72DRAFT_885473 [Ephemerocybe angulata]|uniref:Uncharacterized protein n=1 Tax=Ephemerocybe angulata TaxID=980116 RepID=A0A8H6MD15_9AGAR|nr:hypothetical protein DFP72DRAFT_885473 [Tulosesus angulatus]
MSIPVDEALGPTVPREEAPLPSQIGDLILRIDDVTETVPARLTTIYAPIFAKIVKLNDQGPTLSEDGDMDHPPNDRAIVITYCTISEFHCFMKVLCGPKAAPVSLAKEEWISVFKLATMWDAHWIRTEAIHEIAQLGGLGSPLEMALLGKKHNVAYWYIEGLCALSRDGDSTPLDQIGEALGWETAARIASAGLATSEGQRAAAKHTALSVPITTLSCCSPQTSSIEYSVQPWRPPPQNAPEGTETVGAKVVSQVVSARRIAFANWECQSPSYECPTKGNRSYDRDRFLKLDSAAIVQRSQFQNTHIIKRIFADELKNML